MKSKNQTPKANGSIELKPLFFNRLVALDRLLHSELKFNVSGGLGFARATHLIPITIAEFRFVARFYPIIFSGADVPMPFAVVGVQQGVNLFVDAEGRWRPRTYVPGAVHTYPFILLPTRPDSDDVSVVIDADAPSLGDQGQDLFVNGEPSPFLERILNQARQFRSAMMKTAEFGRALKDADVMTERGIEMVLQTGAKIRMDHFLIIDPEKFDKLANNVFLRWRKDGWLLPTYQFFQSLDAWNNLADLETDRRAAAGS